MIRYSHAPLLRSAWELRHELTAYEAFYLALAKNLGAILVTGDGGLAARARRSLGADRWALIAQASGSSSSASR